MCVMTVFDNVSGYSHQHFTTDFHDQNLSLVGKKRWQTWITNEVRLHTGPQNNKGTASKTNVSTFAFNDSMEQQTKCSEMWNIFRIILIRIECPTFYSTLRSYSPFFAHKFECYFLLLFYCFVTTNWLSTFPFSLFRFDVDSVAGWEFHWCRCNCIALLVWATGIHMDGTAKTWRQLFIASCTKRKTCRCLFDHIACRHNNGLFKWILCASAATGFLCGAAQSDRAGHNNENDSTSSDMGTARDLYSGMHTFNKKREKKNYSFYSI